jgi:hypothetical protein
VGDGGQRQSWSHGGRGLWAIRDRLQRLFLDDCEDAQRWTSGLLGSSLPVRNEVLREGLLDEMSALGAAQEYETRYLARLNGKPDVGGLWSARSCRSPNGIERSPTLLSPTPSSIASCTGLTSSLSRESSCGKRREARPPTKRSKKLHSKDQKPSMRRLRLRWPISTGLGGRIRRNAHNGSRSMIETKINLDRGQLRVQDPDSWPLGAWFFPSCSSEAEFRSQVPQSHQVKAGASKDEHRVAAW